MVPLQDEEPFNPDYVEVDRILDVSHSVDKDNGEVGEKNLSVAPTFIGSVSYFFYTNEIVLIFPLQNVIYYLVKWCSLPYEDATWELNEDVDEGKVEEFKKIQNRQPRLKRTVGNLGILHKACVWSFFVRFQSFLHKWHQKKMDLYT